MVNKKYDVKKEELEEMYINKKMSTEEVAKVYGCCRPMISIYLKKFNLPIRRLKGKTYEELYGKEKAKRMRTTCSIKKVGKENKWGSHSEEARKIMSIKSKGQISKKKGKTMEEIYGEEKAKEIREKIREKRAIQIIPFKDTGIEVKIQNFLKQLGIEHLTHFYISEIEHKYRCDIFIPVQRGITQKIVIECDGDYFHANPLFYSEEELNKKQKGQRERDNLRNKELTKEGFRVIRLWENEINDLDLNKFEKKIIDNF